MKPKVSAPPALQDELQQTRPFRSAAEEATVALIKTADVARRVLSQVVEKQDITLQQYNVLRILRGARGEPLPTLEIRERLIEPTPGITGLLDRLEAKGLVRRERCPSDRRQVHCWITAKGLAVLEELDAPMLEADERLSGRLAQMERKELIRLLSEVRAAGG